MKLETQTFKIRGMQQDFSTSAANSEFAYENRNIRITARNKDTLLSITNELGNKEQSFFTNTPNIIGFVICNEFVLIFSITERGFSKIDRVHIKNKSIVNLYIDKDLEHSLNFNINNPIESLFIYENDNTQKVYWTDNLNQPRVINIIDEDTIYEYTSFNFVPTIFKLDSDNKVKLPVVSINKNYTTEGLFSSGTTQYVITYFNKYLQESAIAYTSDLQYNTFQKRAASPEEKVGISYTLNISNLDNSFDYIRIYAIHRTSLDAVPEVKIISDIEIPKNKVTSEEPIPSKYSSIIYIDNNRTGSIVDPSILLFLGGQELIVNTLTQKDNTLFLGGIKLVRPVIPEDIKEKFQNITLTTIGNKFIRHKVDSPKNKTYSYTSLISNKSSSQVKYLRSGNYYRLGIQLIYKTGLLSEPIYIRDYKVGDFSPTGVVTDSSAFIDIPNYTVELSKDILDLLEGIDIVGYRPVIVLPSIAEKEVITQGVVCPTVFNVKDRKDNSPFVQPSWIFRSRQSDNSYNNVISNKTGPINGVPAVFKHYQRLPGPHDFRCEISTSVDDIKRPERAQNKPLPPIGGDLKDGKHFDEDFYIDESIITLHSPEVEIDNEHLLNVDLSNVKFRIVGVVFTGAHYSNHDITSKTPTYGTKVDLGFNHRDTQHVFNVNADSDIILNSDINFSGFRGMSLPNWTDSLLMNNDYGSGGIITGGNITTIITYWQRQGSLSAQEKAHEGIIYNQLEQNKTSNLIYSFDSMYFSREKYWKPSIRTPQVYNSNENTVLRLDAPLNSGESSLIYQGNIDKIITTTSKAISRALSNTEYKEKENYYNILNCSTTFNRWSYSYIFKDSDGWDVYAISNDPVSMKYKSSPHVVIAFDYRDASDKIGLHDFNQVVLPALDLSESQWYNGLPSTGTSFWGSGYIKVIRDELGENVEDSYLFLGELYKDINTESIFGGNTDESIKNNNWIIGGPTVPLGGLLQYNEGDTYFQRYECLKTYPYTNKDMNSLVEILSFQCESYINLDGRYDKNRGAENNLAMSNTNFNLYNSIYNQNNNFFSYRGVDTERFSLTNFKNIITWSKTKVFGELIDTWTNISLASTLDLDGDKGTITKLENFNNEILCFQDEGIAHILFNSRVQIPTSESVPIEISNSYKVDGKRYLSTNFGVVDKTSICQSPNGLYFIDRINRGIYLYTNTFTNLTDKLGMSTWMKNNINLEDNDTILSTYYDSINKDVYFINKKECLCYSEILGQFTSFFDYNDSQMFMYLGKLYSLYQGKLFEQNVSNISTELFNIKRKYSTSIIINKDLIYNKVFNNLIVQGDWRSLQTNDINHKEFFDEIEVETDYQYNKESLSNTYGIGGNLKSKYRDWKINIPRDKINKLDRMMNPWLKVTLSKLSNLDTMILHSITATYLIK